MDAIQNASGSGVGNTTTNPDRLFDIALVRPPSDSYVNCVSTKPSKSEIDVKLAREQHQAYASILNELGIEVIELPPLEAHPDSVFMQDPALLGSACSIVGRFGEQARRGEAKALIDDLAGQGLAVGALKTMNSPGTLEGGDIMVTDKGIFVGESQRTNSSGIKQLAAILSNLHVTPVKTNLMHLLCGCTYLSEGTIIIAPELVNPDSFPGFRLIKIPKDDAYAADALYLGGNRVLIPYGFPRTIAKLRGAGYKPIETEMSEFYKGDGGVTCLSSPVYKLF